jgi:hypothetical protein
VDTIEMKAMDPLKQLDDKLDMAFDNRQAT